jgi:hypothetical protein
MSEKVAQRRCGVASSIATDLELKNIWFVPSSRARVAIPARACYAFWFEAEPQVFC